MCDFVRHPFILKQRNSQQTAHRNSGWIPVRCSSVSRFRKWTRWWISRGHLRYKIQWINLLISVQHNKNAEFYKQYKEAEIFNQSLASKSNIVSSSSYTTHPQAIYTSRLLDYKNLPEPQNSKEINVNSLAISKYSGDFFWNYTCIQFIYSILTIYNLDSLQMDFEKLDIKGIYSF